MENTKKQQLISIFMEQDKVLDGIITHQRLIHEDVKNRNWLELESDIEIVRNYSDSFVQLDVQRESLTGDDRSLYYTEEIQPLFYSVRTKLSQSKIENEALNSYVSATQAFLNGVIEECIPQERNTLYSPKGIRKPARESIVLNTVF